MKNKKFNIPRVAIIILNWNGWVDTVECLESLYHINYRYYDVIIVDNGSKDNSLQKIENYCEGNIKIDPLYSSYESSNKPISLLKLTKKEAESKVKLKKKFLNLANNRKLILISIKKNSGFARGCNIGSIFAIFNLKPDYILLLNNDTVIEKNFLMELVKISESDDMIGIVGPEILFYEKPHKNQFEDKYKEIRKPTEVEWVSGCAILIKFKLIKSIGLLDTIFFSYYEETDYIERAKKSGYKIVYVPTKHKIYHKYCATTNKIPGMYFFYMIRNAIIFRKKHSNIKEFYLYTFRYIREGIRLYLHTSFFVNFLKGIISGVILSFTRNEV